MSASIPSERTQSVSRQVQCRRVFPSVQQNRHSRSFAVNLLDTNESNIEPREEIRIGGDTFTAGGETPQPREIWKFILLLAVGLLTAEWVVYNRRISV